MIIRGIKAENVLKYRLLDIAEVPPSGLIGVSGPNESGKSSIGEAICFALFGRTFSLAPKDIGKIIRWGEERCSVWLRLGVKDKEYEIARFLDSDGNHSARLSELGREEPLARGAPAVAVALKEVLGYDFEEFIESFYLAQREITAPHPHSYAVKVMAGVAPLETISAQIREELQREEETLVGLAAKLQDVDEQITQLGVQPGHLESMERERRALREREQDRRGEVQGLQEASAQYRGRFRDWRAASGRRTAASSLRVLLLLLGIALGAAWAVLMYAPESAPAQWIKPLAAGIPQFGEEDYRLWLAGGSGVAFLLALLAWYRCSDLAGRLKQLLADNEAFTIRLEGLDEVLDEAGGLNGPPAAEAGGAVPLSGAERTRLRERTARMEAAPSEVEEGVRRDTAWLEQISRSLREEGESLEEEVAQQRDLVDQHNKLRGMREGFSGQVEEHRHRISVRGVAGELLQRAARRSSHRFNHNLRGLVGHTLPLFTEGSYEHLQIDDDLDVRVFSAAKRDFMELEEISSGTQRQIMLALRLALSQQLVDRVIRDSQFVFLDEPFAFFDERRTRSALAVLPKLSEELRQIWVVAQQFPEEAAFAQEIRCDRQSNRLTALAP